MVVNLELSKTTELAFLHVCQRHGETPEEVFGRAARMTIHNYLSELTELAGWVSWFSGPNYGEPFDDALAQAVLEDIERSEGERHD